MTISRTRVTGSVHGQATIDPGKHDHESIWNSIFSPLLQQSAHLKWYGSFTVDLMDNSGETVLVGNVGGRYPVTYDLFDKRDVQIDIGPFSDVNNESKRLVQVLDRWVFSMLQMGSEYLLTIRLHEIWACLPPPFLFGRKAVLSEPRQRVREVYRHFGLGNKIHFIDGDDELKG